jgi:nucleotide-binding universal stress UspA family protein
MADYLSQAEEAARERLATFVAASTGRGRRIRALTKVGPPVEEILEYADAQKIDLIVIGTHGRGLVGQMLLGSVAERVVRRARIAVLTVPATSSRASRSRRATRKAG